MGRRLDRLQAKVLRVETKPFYAIQEPGVSCFKSVLNSMSVGILLVH